MFGSFQISRQDEEYPIQKQFIKNDMTSLPVAGLPLQYQSIHSQIASLENIVALASATISYLKAEEARKQQYEILGLLNNMPTIKLDCNQPRIAEMYRDTMEANTNASSSLTSPKSNESKSEKEAVKSGETVCDSVSEESQKGPKPTQSKFKNCYGLTVGRVVKSCKKYIKLDKEGKIENISKSSPYYYIHQIFSSLTDLEKEKFDNFLDEFSKRDKNVKKNRGKSTMYSYFEQDPTQGVILVGFIQAFLQPDNPDFQAYINNKTKPKKQVSHVLSGEEDLTKLRNAFMEMKFQLEKKYIRVKNESN